ncbi:MAG: rRNA maturation RNase YbeY [Anaerolineales bacterium]|nr:rRNA maturation RNase YbeY [Anaerolineales bacterium]
MITIEIDASVTLAVDEALLERAAQTTLDLQAAGGADLTLVLTGDERIRTLNREYRAMDAPTDVLSFAAGEIDPETGRMYLGDVILSMERAEAQAEALGHDLAEEVQLLIVHGVLHLLGHDHAGKQEKERMWGVQAGILTTLGVSATIVHE